MARLEEIPLSERRMMQELDCSGLAGRRPWEQGPALNKRRIASVSTAALNLRSDAVYQRNETSFRVIPCNVDPEFQKRVIRAALALLDARQGPLLVDYLEHVPAAAAEENVDAMNGMFCSIDVPPLPDKTAPTSEIGVALMHEVASLQPWSGKRF